MAGALLAVEHFNSRNADIVKELANLPTECNVTVSLNVVDTEANGLIAARKLKDLLLEEAMSGDYQLCGIIGPHQSVAGETLGSFAPAWEVPLLYYSEALAAPLVHTGERPWAVAMGSTTKNTPKAILSWMKSKGRTEYIATISSPLQHGTRYREAFSDGGVNLFGAKRVDSYIIRPPYTGYKLGQGASAALYEIKQSGIRNIFIASLDHRNSDMIKAIADAAEETGLNNGNYVWVVNGDLNYEEITKLAMNDVNVSKIVNGMASIRQIDSFVDPQDGEDPFLKAWRDAGTDMVEKLRATSPYPNNTSPSYVEMPSNFFQKYRPREETGFAYDAVMAAAMSHCRAELAQKSVPGTKQVADKPPPKPQGAVSEHMKSLLYDTNFTGASGTVLFTSTGRRHGPFTRDQQYQGRSSPSITFGAYNFRRQEDGSFHWYLTSKLFGKKFCCPSPEHPPWFDTRDGPFRFANNSTLPPPLNRDIPEQNHLKESIRIAGIAISSGLVFVALAGTAWVVVYRNHKEVQQNQPIFLAVVAIGAAVLASSIIPLSFDEGAGLDDRQLDTACMVTPWLAVLGYNAMYLALFSKLLRLDSVLQFQRRTVGAWHVAGPLVIFLLANVTILALWSSLNPLRWERQPIDDDTEESYGRCESEDGSLAFVIPLAILMFSSTALCLWMAYKCRDVDQYLTESNYVFHTVFLQIQTLIISVPVLSILDDSSVDATFWMRSIAIFVVTSTALIFMIGIKVKRVYFPPVLDDETAPNDSGSQRHVFPRGQSLGQGKVRISGLEAPGSQNHSSETITSINPTNDISTSGILDQEQAIPGQPPKGAKV